jgi:hypothetical protein
VPPLIFHQDPISKICLEIGRMVSKRKLRLKFALVFQLYVGQFGIVVMILCTSNGKESTIFFAGYPYGGTLDPAMALPCPGGSVRMHGYYVQPPTDGCAGYFLPLYLAAY